MIKKVIISIVIVSCFMFHVPRTLAQERINNPFGIHLAGISDQDIADVAALVNSNGGDWGYVTIVIQDNDRDTNKWQGIFNKLRTHHLIPIIRLATHPEGPVWKAPTKDDAASWVTFLDSLNWVVKERYVILFNEPNHAQEWGGQANPTDYAQTALEFAKKLKEKNNDFKIMLAGFDASAPQQAPTYIDEGEFLRTIINETPDIFSYVDAWSSHSYPNPGFSGSPSAKGRISVYGYEWESSLLQQLGVQKSLPVFITETGWLHSEGMTASNNFSVNDVADFYQTYLSSVTKDSRVKAVTPFVLDYQGDPFSHFSWKKLGTSEFYPQYDRVKGLPKQKGNPEQLIKVQTTAELPRFLLQDSNYNVRVYIRNRGQAILDGSEGYRLGVASSSADMKFSFSNFSDLEPNDMGILDFRMNTNTMSGSHKITVALYKDDVKQIDLFNWNFEIKPKPNIAIKTVLFPKLKTEDSNYEIQIFDANEELVYKKKNIQVKNNNGSVLGASNVALQEKYRVVILKPYYLPRQTIMSFKEGDNTARFEVMLPVDFNKDGKFSLADMGTLVQHPNLLRLWWFF